MASHTTEREIFAFAENPSEIVSSSRPFSFACDGRLLLCCRETFLIFTISCDLDERSHSFLTNLPCKLNVQKCVDLSTIQPFSIAKDVLDLANTLKNVSSHIDRQELLMDSSLHGIEFLPRTDLGGFRSAIFSPPDSSKERFLIAAVTHDHRVLVFEECCEDWRLCCEFTSKLKSHITASMNLPITLGVNSMSFIQFKNIIYSMSCVEIAWSSLLVHETSSKIETGNLLLFCGMRNGDVHIWKMQTLPDSTVTDENSFTFIAVVEYGSEVTSLFWHCVGSKEGHLVVGYMDGSVRIVNIQMSVNDTEQFDVKVVFEHKPGDLLAVSDLASTKINQDPLILLACKQFYIAIFIMKDISIDFFKTVHIDCSLPLESLSVRGNLASASSQDGTIHHLLFHSHGDDLSVECVKSKVKCLPSSTETTWSCKGAILSPHGALCFSVYKPFSDFNVKGQCQSRFMDRQRLVLSLTPNFQYDNFLVPFQDTQQYIKSGSDVTLRLLFQVQHAARDAQSMETIEKVLNRFVASNRLECLQIARAVTLFEFVKIWKGRSPGSSLTFSKPEQLQELTLMILITHVARCFQSAKDCNVKWQTQLPFMCQWVNESQNRLEALAKCLSVDKKSIDTQNPSHQCLCCLCDSEVKIFDGLLEAKCISGHSARLCCVTFHPIEGSKVRHCLSCNAVALDAHGVATNSIPFVKRLHSCTLCGGRLHPFLTGANLPEKSGNQDF